MQFEKIVQDDGVVLKITGEFDSITAPELRPTFDEVAESAPKKVLLDLSTLRLIDSSGVGAIVSLFKRVRAGGGKFEVTGVQGQPRSIFNVLRLDRVFEIK
jgi:anti-sigma B factor antagonist